MDAFKSGVGDVVTLFPVIDADFTAAAALVRHEAPGLYAGDALHLAICRRISARLLTFDKRQAAGAYKIGIEVVEAAG